MASTVAPECRSIDADDMGEAFLDFNMPGSFHAISTLSNSDDEIFGCLDGDVPSDNDQLNIALPSATDQHRHLGYDSEAANRTIGAIDLCNPEIAALQPRQQAFLATQGNSQAQARGTEVGDKRDAQRERNRQAQARLRERHKAEAKALASREEELRASVAAKKTHARHSRALKETLTQRANSAANSLIAHLSSNPSPAYRPKPPPSAPTQTLTRTTFGRQGLYSARCREQRDVDTFHLHEPMDYPTVTRHAGIHYARSHSLASTPSSGFDPDDSANLKAHVKAYQAAVAEQRGVRVEDVCWFVQLPYEVAPGQRLSMTPHQGSPECGVACVIYHMASLLECALVAAEREELEQRRLTFVGAVDGHRESLRAPHTSAAARPYAPSSNSSGSSDLGSVHALHLRTHDKSWTSATDLAPGHSTFATSSTSPGAASQGKAALVRCAVNELAPRDTAIRHALHSVLSKYRATLPLATWTRAVGDMIKYMEGTHSMASSVVDSNDAQEATKADGCAAPQPDCVSAFWNTLKAMSGTVTGIFDVLLCEAASEWPEAAGWKLSTCSCLQDLDALLADNEARTRELQHAKVLHQCASLMHAPKVTRQLEGGGVCLEMYPGLTVAMIEELNLAIYRALRLTAAQRRELAKVWLTWQEMRRQLESQRLVAAQPLRELPTACCLPAAWLSLITHRAGCRLTEVWECGGQPPLHQPPDVRDPGSLQWTQALLGASAAQTAAAQDAVSALCLFSEQDAEMYEYTVMLRSSSSKCMASQQFAIYYAVQMERRLLVGDWFRIAQLAAQDVRQCRLLGLG